MNGTQDKKLLKTHILFSRDTYSKHYVKKFPHKKRKIRDRSEFERKGTALSTAISEAIAESQGGVYLPKFGYIFNFLIPRKMKRLESNKTSYNHHTDNRIYMPVFIPDAKTTVLRPWIMTKGFNDQLKKKIGGKIKAGFKYKSFAYTIRKLLSY